MITSPEIHAFRAKAELREALAKALQSPELQLAINCIKQAAVPRTPTESEIIGHADIILGRRYLLMSGTNAGFDALLEMVKPPLPAAESMQAVMSKAYDQAPAVREFAAPNV